MLSQTLQSVGMRNPLSAMLVGCSLVAGCGGGESVAPEPPESNLKTLAMLYGRYIAQNRGQPPANEDEFKQYVTSLGSEELAALPGGASDPQSLFTSPRDQKPYKVLYGPDLQGLAGDVVAYEQDGVDGKRFVADSLGVVEEMDEAQLKQLAPNAP